MRSAASPVLCESAAASGLGLSAPAFRGRRGRAVCSARVRFAGSRRPHPRRGRCSRVAGGRNRLWGSVGPGRCRPARRPAAWRVGHRDCVGQPARATRPGCGSVHRPGQRPSRLHGARASYPCRCRGSRWRRCCPGAPASATLFLVYERRGHVCPCRPLAIVPVATHVGCRAPVPSFPAVAAQTGGGVVHLDVRLPRRSFKSTATAGTLATVRRSPSSRLERHGLLAPRAPDGGASGATFLPGGVLCGTVPNALTVLDRVGSEFWCSDLAVGVDGWRWWNALRNGRRDGQRFRPRASRRYRFHAARPGRGTILFKVIER
jgi:hypothetical protein